MNNNKKHIVLNLERCVACHSCSSACYYGHNRTPNAQYGTTRRTIIPLICRQCEDAACVEACPEDALFRTDYGIVMRSISRCVGCSSCVFACPFGVIQQELVRHIVAKCDLCEDRVEQGLDPRCVATCPTSALKFVDIEDVEEENLLVLSRQSAGQYPSRRR